MKKILTSIAILLSVVSAWGQNNSGTPYSKFGFGMLPDNYGSYTAMGGVSAAMRDNYNINFLNPASYTALDSLRFYFQLGITGEYVDISTNKLHSDYKVGQNASVTMAFRVYKKMFMSLGLTQRSDRGFDLFYSNSVVGDMQTHYLQQIEGEGGLNEAYAGLAYQFGKLSVGVNMSYIFGKIEDRLTLVLQPATSGYYIKTRKWTQINSTLFTFGAQLPFAISRKSDLTLGASFNFGTPFDAEQTFEAYKMSNISSGMIQIDNEKWENSNIFYPSRIIAGATYQYNKKLLISGDYTFQNMSQYEEFSENQEFQNYHKIALGGSYTPNATGREWWRRNRYMAGGYFTKSHIRLQETNINTYGITFGTQMPLRIPRQELMLGVAVDLGMRGTHRHNQILEKYAKIRINIAFKEIWFGKSKID